MKKFLKQTGQVSVEYGLMLFVALTATIILRSCTGVHDSKDGGKEFRYVRPQNCSIERC